MSGRFVWILLYVVFSVAPDKGIQLNGKSPQEIQKILGPNVHLHLVHWAGRVGNQLRSVLNMFSLGQCFGMKKVHIVPGKMNGAKQLFKPLAQGKKRGMQFMSGWYDVQPSDRVCKLNPELTNRNLVTNSSFLWAPLQEDFELQNEVMRRYVSPRLFAGALATRASNGCGRGVIGFDGLTIHLRGGDVLEMSSHFNRFQQPPCVVYDDILSTTSFKKILIVKGPESHPCAQYLYRKYSTTYNITVQSLTPGEDTCSFITSSHIVLSRSSFSQQWLPAITTLKSVWWPSNTNETLANKSISELSSEESNRLQQLCRMYPLKAMYYYPGVWWVPKWQQKHVIWNVKPNQVSAFECGRGPKNPRMLQTKGKLPTDYSAKLPDSDFLSSR